MTDQTEALFTRIEQFIKQSRAMLAEGGDVDATGLDEQVQHLCRTVLQLSQQERVAHADRMQELLQGLHDLGEDMVTQRDALKSELQQLNQQKKAQKAYKVVDASDRYGKRDEQEE